MKRSLLSPRRQKSARRGSHAGARGAEQAQSDISATDNVALAEPTSWRPAGCDEEEHLAPPVMAALRRTFNRV